MVYYWQGQGATRRTCAALTVDRCLRRSDLTDQHEVRSQPQPQTQSAPVLQQWQPVCAEEWPAAVEHIYLGFKTGLCWSNWKSLWVWPLTCANCATVQPMAIFFSISIILYVPCTNLPFDVISLVYEWLIWNLIWFDWAKLLLVSAKNCQCNDHSCFVSNFLSGIGFHHASFFLCHFFYCRNK